MVKRHTARLCSFADIKAVTDTLPDNHPIKDSLQKINMTYDLLATAAPMPDVRADLVHQQENIFLLVTLALDQNNSIAAKCAEDTLNIIAKVMTTHHIDTRFSILASDYLHEKISEMAEYDLFINNDTHTERERAYLRQIVLTKNKIISLLMASALKHDLAEEGVMMAIRHNTDSILMGYGEMGASYDDIILLLRNINENLDNGKVGIESAQNILDNFLQKYQAN